MITWGMVGNSHDASLAVFETKIAGLTDRLKTKLKWAGLAKDFTGVPNDPDFNWTMLETARQTYGSPDLIVWYEKPFLKTLRQFRAGQGWNWKENNIKKYLARWDIDCKIVYAKHHEAHAAYGYYTSPFMERSATVICLDSIGEFETLTIWNGEKRKLKSVYSQSYPHSVGLFYSAMTQRCGLVANRDEYKIAEMAKKGNDSLVGLVTKAFIDDELDGAIPGVHFKHNLHKGCNWFMPELTSKKDMNNLAYATQAVYERILKSLSDWCIKNLPSKNLILVGGCALNKQANETISQDWKNIYVPKNPGDPGSCIGAVLSKTKKHLDIPDNIWYNK